jgi:hypothetical protein
MNRGVRIVLAVCGTVCVALVGITVAVTVHLLMIRTSE